MLNKKLEKYLKEESSINKSILPADLYFSKEILRPLDNLSTEDDPEKYVYLSVKAIQMSKYNYEGREIQVPVKAISKILSPEKILQK